MSRNTEPEPDMVVLGNCCPDGQSEDAIVDPHMPERSEAVSIAQSIYPADHNAMSAPNHVPVVWHGRMTVEKYRAGESTPYEVIEGEPNLLLDAGIAFILDRIIGTSGTSFSNANAYIGVGDSSTAAAAGQTNLQAATNKMRKAMDATFPSRSGNVLTFRSTFATTDANWAWLEWGLFNASTAGTMLNRSVSAAYGTKTSADTWISSVACTMSGT